MVLDEHGKSRPVYMGSYGIGLERNLAAIVETHYDEKGIVWPVTVAPYEAVVTVLKLDDETVTAADTVYRELLEAGVDVIIDDRDERPGVKFNDAELVGIPYRITIGPRGLGNGLVEVTQRATAETTSVPLAGAAAAIAARIQSQRR
jgi:prolyl-tRNA synthetase